METIIIRFICIPGTFRNCRSNLSSCRILCSPRLSSEGGRTQDDPSRKLWKLMQSTANASNSSLCGAASSCAQRLSRNIRNLRNKLCRTNSIVHTKTIPFYQSTLHRYCSVISCLLLCSLIFLLLCICPESHCRSCSGIILQGWRGWGKKRSKKLWMTKLR